MKSKEVSRPIFIINGSGSKGKDQFVEDVNQFISVYNVSSVDIIKEMARNVGWNGSKTEKDRKFLADLKTLCTEYNDSPYKYIFRCVTMFRNTSLQDAMFIHIREPKEIERAVKQFGAKTILVKSDRVEDIASNPADAGVYDYNYDYVIENNGTLEDLKNKAEEFVKTVIKGEQNQ